VTITVDASGVTITSPTVTIDGALVVTGSVTSSDLIAGGGISFNTHYHPGVTTGSGNTGGPA
jgi:phage baseplate assembly protein gpV